MHRIAICVGLAALGVAAATSAQAQVYGEPGMERPLVEPMIRPMFQPRLPPNEVLMIVRASGLRPLTQPAPRGTHYVLLASDNMGGQLRVVVNGNNGRIINAAPAYDPRFAYHPTRPRGMVPMAPSQQGAPPPSYSAAPNPELKDAPSPARTARATPPQAPAPQAPATATLAGTPDGAKAARPERTPLPRPRPVIASNEAAAPAPTPEAAPAAATPPAATTEQPAASPAPSAAPARAAETQMVPVAPLD